VVFVWALNSSELLLILANAALAKIAINALSTHILNAHRAGNRPALQAVIEALFAVEPLASLALLVQESANEVLGLLFYHVALWWASLLFFYLHVVICACIYLLL